MARSASPGGKARNASRTTALADYIKLEATGQYFAGPEEAAQDVVVSFGARSLVIIGFDEHAVAHWPLATLVGAQDGASMAFMPDEDAPERVVLQDPAMIGAIRTVCPALLDRHIEPPPRRQRRWVPAFFGTLLIAAVAGFFALPLFADHLARAYPAASARALGTALVDVLRKRPPLPVQICAWPDGTEALSSLAMRVAQGPLPPVVILDRVGADMLVLPGGWILIERGLLDLAATPEEMAALLAHGLTKAEMRAPVAQMLASATPWQIIAMNLSTPTDEDHLQDILTTLRTPRASMANDALLSKTFDRLSNSGLPATAFATLADRLDGAALSIRFGWDANSADAARSADKIGGGSYKPALNDRDWLALQNICDETRPL